MIRTKRPRADRAVSARIRARADDRIRAGTEHRQSLARVMASVMAEFVPLDERRPTEFRVRAFAGRALDVPAFAEVDVETAVRLRDDIARAVHNGKECGEVAAALDPCLSAVRLVALTEGLAAQVYRDPATTNGLPAADLSASVIAAGLSTIFTGACGQYADRAGT